MAALKCRSTYRPQSFPTSKHLSLREKLPKISIYVATHMRGVGGRKTYCRHEAPEEEGAGQG